MKQEERICNNIYYIKALMKEAGMERNKDKICTVRDIIDMIESVIPVQLQESWDNSGAQVISADSGVRKVLLAIDIDKRVVEEATAVGADMIVTHHPLMFDECETYQ